MNILGLRSWEQMSSFLPTDHIISHSFVEVKNVVYVEVEVDWRLLESGKWRENSEREIVVLTKHSC